MSCLAHRDEERLTTIIRALERHHERFRMMELERARRSLARGVPAKVLEELARRLTNKFLHVPLHVPLHALNHATAPERARLPPLLLQIYCRSADPLCRTRNSSTVEAADSDRS